LEFGVQPLVELAKAKHLLPAHDLIKSLLAQAADFRSGVPGKDDLTLMVLERTE
jgi:serine phosphatase RsbU (regulator of sigma subunit)